MAIESTENGEEDMEVAEGEQKRNTADGNLLLKIILPSHTVIIIILSLPQRTGMRMEPIGLWWGDMVMVSSPRMGSKVKRMMFQCPCSSYKYAN